MTRPALIRQGDVARLLRGAKRSGYASVQVEIDPSGKITLTASDDAPATQAAGGNPWDEVFNDGAKKLAP